MTEQEYKKLTAEITTLNQKIEVLNSKSEMVNSQRKKILSELGLPTDIKETELKELVEKERVKAEKAYNEMLEAKKDREEQVRLLEEAINEYES
mgnify:FL=1